MTTLLAGKTALITGGGIGIGQEIAVQFAQHGARVALTYRSHQPDPQLLDTITAASGHEPLLLPVDATSDHEVQAALITVQDRFGALDILVNNVGGLVKRAGIVELDLDLWHTVLAVNLDSMFLFTHHAVPHLTRGAGRIINIASLAGRTGGHAGALAYATAKAGVFGFTRSLATELAPQGITVNALAPGFIEATPFHDTFTTAASKAKTVAGIPAGRAGNPADVAGPAVYLASELSAFVTGTIVDINGGQHFA